jgi:hypothetical protein
VNVHYVRPNSTTLDRTVTTDSKGHYVDSQATGSNTGTWVIQVRYDVPGTGSSTRDECLVRVVSAPPPNTQPSSISLNCPQDVQHGPVTVTGAINPNRNGVPVHLSYQLNSDSPQTQNRNTTTDANSQYSDTASLSEGDWTIQAYWDGDSQYQTATSSSCHVFVQFLH